MPDLRLGITIAVNKETGAIDIAGRELEGLAQQATAAGAAAQTGAAGFSALAATLAPLISGAAVVAFFKSAADEALKAQEATARLTAALKNQGIESDDLVQSMEKHASALQQVTRYEDDAILEGQALLVSFGQLGEANTRATKAALDLAAGLRIDLSQAFQLVAKASNGQTEALGRYGIKVSEAIPEGQKFAAVLEQVEKRFGGRAQADAETYAGKIDQLKNSFSDMKEKLGNELLPALGQLTERLQAAVGPATGLATVIGATGRMAIQTLVLFADTFKNTMDLVVQSGIGAGNIIANFFKGSYHGMVAAAREAKANVSQIFDELVADAKKSGADILEAADHVLGVSKEKKAEEVTAAKEASEAIVSARRQQAEDEAFISEEATQKRRQGMSEELETQQRWAIAIQKVKDEDLKKDQKRREQQKAAAAETISFIAGQTKTGISQLDSVIKAAQIADATRNTFKAANVALASAPPPFNFALAGAVVAVGLANVAKIAAMAEGGRSDTPILTAFAEKEGESAVPDSKAPGFALGVIAGMKSGTRLPSGGGGDAGAGGQVVVNANITVVSPDPARAGEAVMDALLELAERGGPKVERLGKILEGGAVRFGARST